MVIIVFRVNMMNGGDLFYGIHLLPQQFDLLHFQSEFGFSPCPMHRYILRSNTITKKKEQRKSQRNEITCQNKTRIKEHSNQINSFNL